MFKVRSGKLKTELRERQNRWSGGRLVAKIEVPPELIWWYWQEFGTALYAEKGTLPGNEVGYDVPNANNTDAHILVFYDYRNGALVVTKHAFVYGIEPKHMVTSTMPAIRELLQEEVGKAILQGGYSQAAFEAALFENIMPAVKELIRASFEATFAHSGRPEGRLAEHDYSSADQAFNESAEITITKV